MTLRCILVDDNDEFLAAAEQLLAAQGLEIVGRARTGSEALALAAQLRPDVALVDIELDEEDGIELSEKFERPTRVVLISSYERDDLLELVAESSAAGFVPKRLLGASAIQELLRH